MIHVDSGFMTRVDQSRFEMARDRLLRHIRSEIEMRDISDAEWQTFTRWVEDLWREAEPLIKADHPVVLQRYVLIQMTRSRWQDHPIHGTYAARMIGEPSTKWRLEDGINAVYRNVVAAHHLKANTVAILELEAKA